MAISATYVVMVVMGHGVMRLVAGPARADRFSANSGSPPNQIVMIAPPHGNQPSIAMNKCHAVRVHVI